jgi:NAD(P)H-hydrate epimerase
MQEINLDVVRNILKKRPKDAYKNNFGHALLVAGSKGKIGAAVLSSKACMRSGVGLVSVCSTNGSAPIFHAALPEVMVLEDANKNFLTKIPEHENYCAYGIGPGIDTQDETIDSLELFLKENKKPIVLDADGINAISLRPKLRSILNTAVLTPHVGECKSLLGIWSNEIEKFEKIQSFVEDTRSVLVLKGAQTKIFSPGCKIFVNTTGNPGMAKAGSGDVLTGIITALLAQGYASLHAALVGVFVHGLASDLAIENGSNYSLLASDICDFLPKAFRNILGE